MQSSNGTNIGKSKNQVKPVYHTAYFSFVFLEVLYVKVNGRFCLFDIFLVAQRPCFVPYVVFFVLKDAMLHDNGAKPALNDICGPDEGLKSRSKKNRVADSVCDCQGMHVFGDAIYVGDVRPFLWVGVDAHIYQFSQLEEKKKIRQNINNS